VNRAVSPILARATLAAALLSLAASASLLAWRLFAAPDWLAGRHPNLSEPFAADGMFLQIHATAAVLAAAAFLCGLGSVAAFLPGRPALAMVRAGFVVAYAAVAAWLALATRGVAVIAAERLTLDELPQDAVTLFKLWWSLAGPALLPLAVALFAHVQSWRGSTINSFTGSRGRAASPAAGDRIVENIRVGGSDPLFRRSWLGSFSAHLLLIVIIPWLLQSVGCREWYRVPHGSGEEAVAAVVAMTKPVKKKKRRFVLNLNSAIIFSKPDLDKDSEIEQVVEQASEIVYTADTTTAQARAGGKMGKGGGKEGGWPDGVGDDPVRFIRIRHGGPEWDDGMDELSRADMNFLEEFRRITGFKIARAPEARTIGQLRNFDKGYQPPFLFLTGGGGIPVTASDVKTLREYLLGGGMLFADAGSPDFHRGFQALMAAVFPDKQLVVISDDDPIFQGPFVFPNGAPPLWHHGGYRALGIKHRNRWAVFYHPGDLNDAWKTGHSGMSREMAEASYQLGVNIIYHAFTNYLDLTRKYRQ
jgi:hypothetical protein